MLLLLLSIEKGIWSQFGRKQYLGIIIYCCTNLKMIFSDVNPLGFLFSKLQSDKHREAHPGSGARGRGSSLLSPGIHPPGRLPARCSLAPHHSLLFPEEQLGGSAAQGDTFWSMH